MALFPFMYLCIQLDRNLNLKCLGFSFSLMDPKTHTHHCKAKCQYIYLMDQNLIHVFSMNCVHAHIIIIM